MRTVTNYGDPVKGADGIAKSGVAVTFQLVDEAKRQPVVLFDADDGDLIVGDVITATTNGTGVFTVSLWENNKGEVATCYKVRYAAGVAGVSAKPFYIKVNEGETDLTLLEARTTMAAIQPQTLSLFSALLTAISEAVALVTTTTNGIMSYVDKVKLDTISTTGGNTTLTGPLVYGGIGLQAGALANHATFRNISADTASRVYIMPKGAPAGTASAFKIFGTDYEADSVNYRDFGFYYDATAQKFYLNGKANGTFSNVPLAFAFQDGAYVAGEIFKYTASDASVVAAFALGGAAVTHGAMYSGVGTYFEKDAAFANGKMLRWYRADDTSAATGIRFTASNDLEFLIDGTVRGKFTAAGNLTVGGTVTVGQLALAALNEAPASASAAGTAREIRVTANYVYVCIATDTWVRAALTTW